MFLQRFSHQGIRNLASGKIDLAQDLNIFFGDNGAGKSSILEAIGLLTTGRSFRTSKIDLVVNDNSSEFTVFGASNDGHRFGLGYQKSGKKKAIKIDGEKVANLSSLTQYYPCQFLSPESYHLIDSGPAERRKYLDWCLFHVEHMFHPEWKKYSQVLKQRNALLKNADSINKIEEQLAIWDDQICDSAKIITQLRSDILDQLSISLSELLTILDVDFQGSVSIQYYPGYSSDLRMKLIENRLYDLKSGSTRSGPHKADVRIKIDGHLAKDYLSRGQKKVLINALFLAQTQLLKCLTDKDSLFIIDDFSSELDKENQQALLTTLFKQKNVQIILSCLHLESLNWLKTRYNMAHMFHVEHGTISQFHDESKEPTS